MRQKGETLGEGCAKFEVEEGETGRQESEFGS
jgi:hypothetical protein